MSSDLRFECPNCGQHVAVEETGAGMTVNCASCNQRIEIPRTTTPPPPPIPLVPAVKQTPPPLRGRLIKCRDCGHAISSKASRCPSWGARILIPLTDSARGDRRFNPIERKPTQVIVWVEGHDAPIFSFQ